ncbi:MULTISPECIES: MarR family winged helix-turn-helix transcriptional regulator [Microbulbifer]|uniref:MarR family winged helix-turn-helix transcriptional regulator n=1 Tax=Microbulbifer celer TaxID=435905 RepID=A0ABW3U779_9GAMM|nr:MULTISPECIES: MarR family transcriptional regulator [Microbulbifer]UFN56213.1 MarR family transcriptional regulator [Microbulbifer celer]
MAKPEGDALHLDRQLCFALYASSRAMIRAYQPMLRALGITYPQYLVLLLLWQWADEKRSAEAITVGALGEHLMLDSGTLTPLLKRMEGAGLLTRQRSITDERTLLIALTEEGRSLQPRAQEWRDRALGQLDVPRERLAFLHGELWGLLDQLRKDP